MPAGAAGANTAQTGDSAMPAPAAGPDQTKTGPTPTSTVQSGQPDLRLESGARRAGAACRGRADEGCRDAGAIDTSSR